MKEEAKPQPTPGSGGNLAEVKGVVDRWLTLQAELSQAELLVKRLEASIKDIEEGLLPSMFEEAKMSKASLEDGTALTMDEEIYTSVPKDTKMQAIDWLIKHGGSGIVKTEVKQLFGTEQLDVAMKEYNRIAGRKGANVTIDQSVHASTLRSFIKERIKAGVKFPANLFSIQTVTKVSIKLPKGK